MIDMLPKPADPKAMNMIIMDWAVAGIILGALEFTAEEMEESGYVHEAQHARNVMDIVRKQWDENQNNAVLREYMARVEEAAKANA